MNDLDDLVRVSELASGDVILGTGPSGPYERGPQVLQRIAEIPPTDPRRPEYRLWFDSGWTLIYYASTQVIRAED